MMIPGYPEQLYKELRRELQRIKDYGLRMENELEESFGACIMYEKKLIVWVSPFHFENVQDEIYFFKTMRPKFSCLINYFKKRYHTLVFRPSSETRVIPFFEYEIDIADRYFAYNNDFYQYYKSGQTFNDEVYFLRSCAEGASADDPCRSETAYSLLLAEIQGLEQFKEYVQMQLAELRKI